MRCRYYRIASGLLVWLILAVAVFPAHGQIKGIERGGGFDKPFVPVRVRRTITVKKPERRPKPTVPTDTDIAISEGAMKRYQAGAAAYQRADFRTAISELEAAVKIEKNFTDAYIDLGDAYFDNEQFAQASDSYRKAIALEPTNTDAQYRLGRVSFVVNDYESAAEAFKHVVAARETDPLANYNLGLALKSLRRYEEATPIFERAIANGPEKFPEPWINLSRCYLELKRTEDAENAARKGLEMLEPDSVDSANGWYALASVLSVKPDLPNATEALDKAIAVCVNCPAEQMSKYYFALGAVHEGQGHRNEAVVAYEKFLSLAPDLPDAVIQDIKARIERLRAIQDSGA